VQNPGFWKYLRNTQAITKLTLTPPFAKISSQYPRQFGDHLLAVLGPLPLQQFTVDPSSDLPVELGEFGVDYTGHLLPGGINEMAHIDK
jgi:hypothetical protein